MPVLEIDTDELHDPRYAANPSNRCYFCKTELWTRLVPVAAARGLAVVVDGTNADDLFAHRPGKDAAAEHGVRSPLAELGFTKDEIRDALTPARHSHMVAAGVAVPCIPNSARNRGHAGHDWAGSSGPSVRCGRSAWPATCGCAISAGWHAWSCPSEIGRWLTDEAGARCAPP